MITAIDISSVQGAHPNLGGVDIVFIKSTEGHSYANPDRASQAAAARSAGKPIGWYHFLWPGNIAAQVAWFLKCTDWRSGDVLALDWETTTAGSYASCAEKDAFLALLHTGQPKARRLLYANLDYWKNHDTTAQCGDGLWIADPGAAAGHPRLQHSWVVHQYGERGGVDLDVVNVASVAAWRAWAGAAAPTPTPKPAPYKPPAFPAGLAPGKSRPSAQPLQKALRATKYLSISDGDLADEYGPRTQAAVGRFLDAHPQFKSKGKVHDVAIGPEGWAFLFTLAYAKK